MAEGVGGEGNGRRRNLWWNAVAKGGSDGKKQQWNAVLMAKSSGEMRGQWQKATVEGGDGESTRKKRESASSLFSKRKRARVRSVESNVLLSSRSCMSLMSFSHAF